MNREESWCSQENIVIGKLEDETYLFLYTSYSSEETMDWSGVQSTEYDIYNYRTWKELWENALSPSLKKELKEKRRGNVMDNITGNELDFEWKKISSVPLKKMVREWFSLEDIMELSKKKKIKKYTLSAKQKKQISSLIGMDKVCYTFFDDSPSSKELVIIGKRKDGKYICIHNIAVRANNPNKDELVFQIKEVGTWKELWDGFSSSLRRKIK